jgi:uncharacterized membrane protein YhaH (DUF805 family)
MKKSFLSSEGCLGRGAFIFRIALIAAVAGALSYAAIYYFAHNFHHGTFGTLGVFLSIVFCLLASMAGLMQLLRRLRDMGKEAYLTLLMLIPGVNLLFLFYTFVAPSKRE